MAIISITKDNICLTVGLLILGLYCVVASTPRRIQESFVPIASSTQMAIVSNDVDILPAEWSESMEEDIGPTPSCGQVELRPKIGSDPAGFYPKKGDDSIKNCNIGEALTVTNKLTSGGDVQQMVSCRITPHRSFTCDSQQLAKKAGCTFPPFLYSGKYQCNSAKPNLKEPPYQFSVVVNNDGDTTYSDRGPTLNR